MEQQSILNKFEKYCQLVKMLPSRPSDEDLLILYGLFKQATVGDCYIPKPGGIFNVKEKRKWEAWNEISGLSREDAMNEYIHKVEELMN
tara:strand:- start:364 stop:630 length:267 start_codon:yes stop_codon:yes gene_type:complete